jgi:hypothetical protein
MITITTIMRELAQNMSCFDMPFSNNQARTDRFIEYLYVNMWV